ncbi:MAG: glycosyltransferase, partial [Pseudomonadales bacterium]|nr:glycosyltransferase [Pseudomonadales bacterium]
KLKIKTPLVVLPQQENLGFARAINLAVEVAKYNYIYLMNNDMEAQSNTFSKLIEFVNELLKRKQVFFSIASQVFFFDPNKPRQESGKTYCFTKKFGLIDIRHMINSGSLEENSLTLYAGGGSSLFNKKMFLELGGFDADRFKPMYVEDLDLGVTAWEHGYPSYFCANSHILHHHRASSTKWKVSPDDIIRKNLGVFMRKHWKFLRKPLLRNFVEFELNEGQKYL